MRFLSLFSGIEAASVAWNPLGWECAAVAEIDPFASAVIAHRHPGVPNLGDVTKITESMIQALAPLDVVIFGSPCQDLSTAGKRAGLAGSRSGLFHEGMRIFDAARRLCDARFCLWENVVGSFSSHGGRDFASVVAAMVGLESVPVPEKGWGTEGCAVGPQGLLEWCVLDAQWFGVAQRRRRVFALLDTGEWTRRPPVLLEPESSRGDCPARGSAQKDVAPTLAARTKSGGGPGTDFDLDGGLIPETVGALTDGAQRGGGLNGQDAYTGRIFPVPAYGFNWQNGGGYGKANDGLAITEEGTGPLIRKNIPAVAYDSTQITHPDNRSNPQPGDPCHTLARDAKPPIVVGQWWNGDQVTPALTTKLHDQLGRDGHAGADNIGAVIDPQLVVRRLTVRECERLMGLPDLYTAVPYRGRTAANSPRYRAIGNSMAVPVIHWIGRKLQEAVHAQA